MAVGGFLSRFTKRGANASTLAADLKCATDSEIIDIPSALLDPVVQAAGQADDRREIMKHLQACLATSGQSWRRVHAGLVLAETLLQKGPEDLLVETAQGLHFDLAQRLAFLEHFQYVDDRRVQHTIRTKARALRAELVPRLQDLAEVCLPQQAAASEVLSDPEPSAAAVSAGDESGTAVPCGDLHGEPQGETPDLPASSPDASAEVPEQGARQRVSNFLSRFARKGTNTLLSDLRRVTESEIVEIPDALIAPVLLSAGSEEDRREIMKHLQSCLATSGKQWRCVHAALVLAEALVEKGPQELLAETARGQHFDLVQRLAFLEKFEYVDDRRIQNTIRTKAKVLRADLILRLQDVGDLTSQEAEECAKDSQKDTASTGSADDLSMTTSISGGYDGFGSDTFMQVRPQFGNLVLNGIVAVGHADDTTSESSNGEEDKQHRRVGQCKVRKSTRQRDAAGIKKESVCSRSQLAAASSAVAESVDLLGL